MTQNFEQQAFLNPTDCLMKVKTIFGDSYWINKNQLEHHRAIGLTLLHCYRWDGRRLRVKNNPKEFQCLHISNIQEA